MRSLETLRAGADGSARMMPNRMVPNRMVPREIGKQMIVTAS